MIKNKNNREADKIKVEAKDGKFEEKDINGANNLFKNSGRGKVTTVKRNATRCYFVVGIFFSFSWFQ